MRKFLIGMASGILSLGVAMAQSGGNAAPAQQAPAGQMTPPQSQAAQPGTPSAPVTRIAPGSVIPVALTKTIDAKKAKTGEEVVAKVTQDMKSGTGELIFAKDTKVVGHVTQAQARSKEQKESEIGIAFDHAVTRDGRTLTVPMEIQAIVAPQNNNNDSQSQSTASAPSPSPSGGHGMGGSGTANQAPPASGGSDGQSGSARPPINAQTQGVIGISDLSLTSTAANANQGSVMTSVKSNVKIEGGTMLLLRVSQ